MRFLTDFADQAVVLPLIATVALALALLGWWRGALAWLATIGLCFGAVLSLKLLMVTCAPAMGLPVLRSPSGHTAAAAVIAGGVAGLLGWPRVTILAVAVGAAVLIGATRVALGLHTGPEVILGGMLGIAGAVAFASLAGPVPRLRLRWVFAVILVVALLLHGQHLNAEPHIRAVAFTLPFCTDHQPR